ITQFSYLVSSSPTKSLLKMHRVIGPILRTGDRRERPLVTEVITVTRCDMTRVEENYENIHREREVARRRVERRRHRGGRHTYSSTPGRTARLEGRSSQTRR